MKIRLKILLIIFGLLLSCACRNKTPEEIEDIISKSSSLERVNQICMQLPKPDDFRFVRKGLAGNTNTSVVVLYYLTYNERDKIRAFYENWAKENGWQTDFNLFKKGKHRIVIEFQPMYDFNFAISCEESL